jgi:hypothetical protein
VKRCLEHRATVSSFQKAGFVWHFNRSRSLLRPQCRGRSPSAKSLVGDRCDSGRTYETHDKATRY